MLNTVEQCKQTLKHIDFELQRLTIERENIVRTMKFLENNPKPEVPTYSRVVDMSSRSSRSSRILEIIRTNPGIDGRSIRELLGDGTTPRSVTFTLSNLRVSDRIENRGGSGIHGSWYIKERI